MDAPKLQDALVIGGCGCLGHHIVKQLVADHDTSNITVLDIGIKHNNVKGVTYIQGSLCSREAILSVLQQTKPAS